MKTLFTICFLPLGLSLGLASCQSSKTESSHADSIDSASSVTVDSLDSAASAKTEKLDSASGK